MRLRIQVSNDAGQVLDETIEVPDEIPYPPTAVQGGPISLQGLRTALDYDLFEKTS